MTEVADMVQIREILSSIGALFTNLFEHPDWHNIVDVAILAILIYNVIKLVMHTRSNSLFKGIAVVLIIVILIQTVGPVIRDNIQRARKRRHTV